MLKLIILLFVIAKSDCQLVTKADFYKVAIIEYHPEVIGSFAENLNHNLNNYKKIVENISENNNDLDIVIFPEEALMFQRYPYTRQELLKYAVKIPNKNEDPDCTLMINHLDVIRCLSKRFKVYILVNLIEKDNNDEMFNTNVVFDRRGHVVSSYRKMHLFAEIYISTPSKKVAIFDTDFGVTFGMFTCFDILFRESVEESIQSGVKHFLFPSYWFSELPHLTSIQVHHGWALKYDSVLIACGTKNITGATGGSGIYLGRKGPLTSILTSNDTTNVIIGHVPKDHHRTPALPRENVREKLDKFYFWKDAMPLDLISLETEVTLHNNTNYLNRTFCYKNTQFCCHFALEVSSIEYLFIAMYDGPKQTGGGVLNVQVCMVLQSSPSGYKTLLPKEYFKKTFNALEVTVLKNDSNVDYFPKVDKENLFFLPVNSFDYDSQINSLKLTTSTDGIYQFGFYGLKVPTEIK